MTARPLALAPSTPSSLLSSVVALQRYPTTLLIAASKDAFVTALAQDVRQHHRAQPPDFTPEDAPCLRRHPLLCPSLMQVAASRHIRTVFLPTVTHLHAYLSTFSASKSVVSAPPHQAPSETPPWLLAYGLVDLHRGGSEWSAQGIAHSLAAFVECAAGEGFRAVIVEPKTSASHGSAQAAWAERVPVLSSSLRDDGTCSGRTVDLRRVLGRWFQFDDEDDGKESPVAQGNNRTNALQV